MKKLFIFFVLLNFSLYANELVLGIVPQQSPLKLSKKWNKVTEYLKEETGINIRFKTEKSIPSFEKALYSGAYDLAYMNPYHFIVANKKQKYQAFVRANKQIEGILLSKNKNFKLTKEYLEGKTFLFPAPNAFAATLLTKFELRTKYNFDIDKDAKVLYVNSHDSVYKGVARDVGDIGGGIVRTYNNFLDKNDKEKLFVAYKTSKYPSHPIANHPRVEKEVIKKLQNAFLNMPDDLKNILSIKKFIVTDSSEYEVIKEVKSN